MKYAGADLIEDHLKTYRPDMILSDLGRNVADLLGELFLGIYHIDSQALDRVDWSNKTFIVISIGWRSWSTVDFDTLTRLVFLAHHRALRVDLTPSKYNYMRLLFHQRSRSGNSSQRHPTLDEAVEHFKKLVELPEFQDGEK